LFDNIYKNKVVLVTGDTGFKGSWLGIWLKELGSNVIGYALEPKTENDNYVICGVENKITHVDGDVRDYTYLKSIIDKYKPEFVFHLAAQSLVLESYNDPLETFSTNVIGTINVLESIRHSTSVKVGIIVTSDKCYENKEWLYGYRENDRLGGKDPYSASKAACEIAIHSYIKSFYQEKGTANVASVRAGNVIGGGDWAENRIVPDCICSLINNKPISIRNPKAVRPWQHVLEPLSGYLKLGASLFKDGKKYQGAWNFGPLTKNMVTVRNLVEGIIEQWGEGEVSVLDKSSLYPEDNFLHLDVSKAINRLEWEPKLSFMELIENTVDEYKIGKLSIKEVYKQRVEHIRQYSELMKYDY